MDTFVFQCENDGCGVFFGPEDVLKDAVIGADALILSCPDCGKEILVSKFEDWPVAIFGTIPKGYEEVDETTDDAAMDPADN